MTSIQAWHIIVSRLKGNQMEFATALKIKRDPVWFSAISEGEYILLIKLEIINRHPNYQCKGD